MSRLLSRFPIKPAALPPDLSDSDNRNPSYGKMPVCIMRDARVTAYEKLLYAYLHSRRKPGNLMRMPDDWKIMEDIGCGGNPQEAYCHLRDLGLIELPWHCGSVGYRFLPLESVYGPNALNGWSRVLTSARSKT